MTFRWNVISNTTGATSAVGTADPSGEPEFTPGLCTDSDYLSLSRRYALIVKGIHQARASSEKRRDTSPII